MFIVPTVCCYFRRLCFLETRASQSAEVAVLDGPVLCNLRVLLSSRLTSRVYMQAIISIQLVYCEFAGDKHSESALFCSSRV